MRSHCQHGMLVAGGCGHSSTVACGRPAVIFLHIKPRTQRSVLRCSPLRRYLAVHVQRATQY